MKIIRTKIVGAVILTAFVLFGSDAILADTVSLEVAFTGHGLPRTQSLEVPTNVVAQIVYASIDNATILVSLPQTPLVTWVGVGLILVGPATITLTNTANAGVSICTIQTSPASAASFTPSSSVVIPNDGAGPVTIILESSTDLINWTAANPGTYGTTSSNRFFRVRAQR